MKKQTIITGALVGSAGIFLSKLIGLLYASPFQALVGQENMVFYTYAYRVYGYLLNVCQAGFPFAIAALVAKYAVREDYQSIVTLRRISFYVMAVFGGVCMLGVILFATPLAGIVSPKDSSAAYLLTTRNVLYIISLALFFVPLLSVFRGYYQGMKELTGYAASQVIEQFVRVGFLLGAGYAAVYGFKQEPIIGVYIAVLSTSVAAIAAIAQFLWKDRSVYRQMKAKIGTREGLSVKVLFQELMRYAMPFMVVSVLGYSYFMVDLLVFHRAMGWYGVSGDVSSEIFSIINFNVDKLTSIPMVLASGFSIALIPFITSNYVRKDMEAVKQNVTDCISSALFLALPLSLVLLCLGHPIYAVFYSGTKESLALGGEVLSWYSLDGLTSTIAPIFTALMMALNLRYDNIKNVLAGVITKAVLVIPLMMAFGYIGALLSSVAGTCVSIILNFIAIKRFISIDGKRILRITSKICLSLCLTAIVFGICHLIGLRVIDQSRMIGLLQLVIVGICGGATYFVSAFYFHIPQTIFHKTTHEVKAMLLHRIGIK